MKNHSLTIPNRALLSILTLTFFFTQVALGQKNIYENKQFKNISASHKSIAILPFLASVNLAQELSDEMQLELEASEGIAVQEALETYFLKMEKRKHYRVDFQNIKDTNAFLKKREVSYQSLDIYSIKELGEILGVDAIISGTITLNVQLSRGDTKAFKLLDYVTGNTKYGRIGIKISDVKTGKLLWKYEKQIDRKTGKNTTELIASMMRQASRKFPYEK
ncbi:secreted protein [Flavobacteria bacterium MS024-3C]|jgi:hypothetical protein|nr:secreted protein [Flavobacteria bacterium MS024-3C]MDA8931720.1 CsgG/HfaB family protein [Flavobacteriaceae bacterium]MDA9273313.1 CsgG/HfaB family protein [Flavobacteriaceae bacterium]MDA9887681.1 CsgG/HfaB family protein [Flavobacteriaceae bacterium]MDA9929344.1 CsgG/HfaB family protein [Flavobacteriaceae bacterium]|tara:strand:+ start:188 stop:847 length:660 start_codon:yes stop_codon:yes gene_type:complete